MQDEYDPGQKRITERNIQKIAGGNLTTSLADTKNNLVNAAVIFLGIGIKPELPEKRPL